jgi:hypothetical protein
LNKSLPSAFQIEFDIKPTSRSSASSYIEIGDSTTNCLLIGAMVSGGGNGVWNRTNNNYVTQQSVTSNTTLNSDNHITFIAQNGNWSYELNSETLTGSIPSYGVDTFLRVYPTSNNKLKNIIVKKL